MAVSKWPSEVWLNTRVPLSSTSPPTAPLVPPAPSCSRDPASMPVRPVKLLSAVRVTEPPPVTVSPPTPEMVPPKLTASERSNTRRPLSATSPMIEPVAPPRPSWRIAFAAMVVPPP